MYSIHNVVHGTVEYSSNVTTLPKNDEIAPV